MTGTAATGGGQDAVRAPLPPHTVLTYRLTPADAMAWERANPSQRKERRLGLGRGVLGGIGLLTLSSRVLPSSIPALHSGAVAGFLLALPMGLVMLLQGRSRRHHVRELLPDPVEVRLEVWDRRLSEHRSDRNTPLVLGPQAVRSVIETDGHVFVYASSGTIIVPASAFADAKAKDDFAGHWESVAG